mmetsp:Transcript_4229/g.12356  ORF Transcript_4229/g.12356 Transcript_4229/m.12356 type:complete len:237 (+) Transcript_4229:3-713(+)
MRKFQRAKWLRWHSRRSVFPVSVRAGSPCTARARLRHAARPWPGCRPLRSRRRVRCCGSPTRMLSSRRRCASSSGPSAWRADTASCGSGPWRSPTPFGHRYWTSLRLSTRAPPRLHGTATSCRTSPTFPMCGSISQRTCCGTGRRGPRSRTRRRSCPSPRPATTAAGPSQSCARMQPAWPPRSPHSVWEAQTRAEATFPILVRRCWRCLARPAGAPPGPRAPPTSGLRRLRTASGR